MLFFERFKYLYDLVARTTELAQLYFLSIKNSYPSALTYRNMHRLKFQQPRNVSFKRIYRNEFNETKRRVRIHCTTIHGGEWKIIFLSTQTKPSKKGCLDFVNIIEASYKFWIGFNQYPIFKNFEKNNTLSKQRNA